MPYAATIMALPVTAVGCDAGPRSGRRIQPSVGLIFRAW